MGWREKRIMVGSVMGWEVCIARDWIGLDIFYIYVMLDLTVITWRLSIIKLTIF